MAHRYTLKLVHASLSEAATLVGALVICLSAITGGLGAALGAGAGAVLGLPAALLTFGLSVPISSFTGAICGGLAGLAFAGIVGIRASALWLEGRILYHPRQYNTGCQTGGRWTIEGQVFTLEPITFVLPLDGDTSQSCFLFCPESSEGINPDQLWVIFGGNAMLALEWLPFCRQLASAAQGRTRLAFLIFEYPGYGPNPGYPRPDLVLSASRLAVSAALARFDSKGPAPAVHLLGHSLGAAAAAQLAASFAEDGLQKAGHLFMSAPFLSIPHMAVQMLGGLMQWQIPLPLQQALLAILAVATPDRWNNIAMVKAATTAGWSIVIFHGAQDSIVPFVQGSELHRIATACRNKDMGLRSMPGRKPVFVSVPSAGHNNVLAHATADCIELMGLHSCSSAALHHHASDPVS